MRTDREKLIELIGREVVPYFAVRIADLLIANGLTFAKDTDVPSKWISVEEKLLDEGEVVMCCHKALEYPIFCQWDESDLCWVNNAWTFGRGLITHWMPMPEPPKEEAK